MYIYAVAFVVVHCRLSTAICIRLMDFSYIFFFFIPELYYICILSSIYLLYIRIKCCQHFIIYICRLYLIYICILNLYIYASALNYIKINTQQRGKETYMFCYTAYYVYSKKSGSSLSFALTFYQVKEIK